MMTEYERREHKRQIRAKSAQKRLKEMQANKDDRAHGTTTGYLYGCKCDRCSQAAKEYRKKIRNFHLQRKAYKC